MTKFQSENDRGFVAISEKIRHWTTQIIIEYDLDVPRYSLIEPRHPSLFREITDERQRRYTFSNRPPLGRGSYGTVLEASADAPSYGKFAIKLIEANPCKADDDIFDNFCYEIAIMKQLSGHRHIVSCVDAYRMLKQPGDYELGIVLHPVADSRSLRHFLTAEGGKRSQREVVSTQHFFGCLANALAFIHEKNIRHKDIALSNILVHQKKVLFTDFGAAFHFAEDHSVTYGVPNPAQVVYKAPEVRENVRRSRPADIFSLGCVFYEIIMVLGSFGSLYAPSSTPFSNPLYHRSVTAHLKRKVEIQGEDSIFKVILSMLDLEPSRRPRARAVSDWLSSTEFSCSDCCVIVDKSDDTASMA